MTGNAPDHLSNLALKTLCWEGYDQPTISELFQRISGYKLYGETHISDHIAAKKIIDERGKWELININTPFVRDVLSPAGFIHPLSLNRFGKYLDVIAPPYRRFIAAAVDSTGRILGLPQRFGPFNLVINTNRISIRTAADEGFDLANDLAMKGRFGILAYDDFNVMHIAIGAGLNPFVAMDTEALKKFTVTSARWHDGAAMITDDFMKMNAALTSGLIDFYLSGGIYTASPARLAGRGEVYAVTPIRGPIGGKGAITFVEVNAIIEHPSSPIEAAEDYIEFIAGDAGAFAASISAGACNPVVQMGTKGFLQQYNPSQLNAMQWNTLHEDLSFCAEYEVMPDYAVLRQIVYDTRHAASIA